MAGTNTIARLRRYGERSSKNKAQLEKWLDENIEIQNQNQGSDIGSASANGSSYSKMAQGMSIDEWGDALDVALLMINKGVKSTSTSYGNIF